VQFLPTGAPPAAELNLAVQLAMGAALVAGMILARRKRFRAHAICQATVVLLNLVMIGLIMAPSFHRQVVPNFQAIPGDRYYALPAAHAAVGTAAELLGLYVILVAGTRIVPKRLRFRRYRPWMRATLALWWLVIALGVATYAEWYGGQPRAAVAAPAPPAPLTADVTVQNFSFGPKEITITAGTTVTWTDSLGRHTVESSDGTLKSDTLVAGKTYQKRFDTPGVYDYYCAFHGNKDGSGMAGRIIVAPR
jgi:plastocyanin/uncharacterized membrane protein YozB (DUF420 family)